MNTTITTSSRRASGEGASDDVPADVIPLDRKRKGKRLNSLEATRPHLATIAA